MDELRDAEVLEELLSGEIAESPQPTEPTAAGFRRAHARAWLRYALTSRGPRYDLSKPILRSAFSGSGLFVLLLGSIATHTHGPWSDFDLLLLHDEELTPEEAEERARLALDRLRAYRREGAPAAFDLRLRPDGGKGALVRSLRSLARYADEGMAPWERLALGNALPTLQGSAEIGISMDRWGPVYQLLEESCTRPLTPEDRRELFAIKARVENERSGGEEDLKLGPGGLMDAEWCVRLQEIENRRFTPGDLMNRADDVNLLGEVERLQDARRRADLGGPEPDPERLRACRAEIRSRFLDLRG